MLIDFIFAIIVLLALYKGYRKGFILAIFSMLALILGLAAAVKFSTVVAGYLKDSFTISAKWLPFLAFIIVFIAIVLLVKLGASIIQKSFQVVMLGWLNRLLGILFYVLLYLIILSIFVFYLERLQILKVSTINSSLTYDYFKGWGPYVLDHIGLVAPFFKDMFTELDNFFNLITNKIQH